MDERERVHGEWGRVYDEHPDVFTIRRPDRIRRLARRDFPRLLAGLPIPKPAKVLEAGCGSGQDALFLASLGHDVTALDLHQAALDRLAEAADTYRFARVAPLSLHLVQGDLFGPSLDRGSFDLVFNSGVVEHLSPELRREALAAMVGLTRPGGSIVVAVPNARHPLTPVWNRLLHWTSDHDTFDLEELDVTLDDLRADFEAAGATLDRLVAIDAWRTLDLYPRWFPLRVAARIGERIPLPPRAANALATRLVAVARAP